MARPKKPSSYKLRLNHAELITDPNSLPAPLERATPKMRVDDNSMPTSFTEIKDYLECPMKYKYRKIFGFSPAVPELFGFGLTTHTAINKIHQNFQDRIPTKQEAETLAEEVFHLKHVFPSRDAEREGPYERAKNKSKQIVGRYVDEYPEDFSQNRQVEVRFEIKADRALITGSIDLLLKEDPAGNILDAKVVDFKSMDYPEANRNPLFWINLSLQVQLYAHAATVVLNENAKKGAVHLLKEKNHPHESNRIEVPISDDAINAALENIKWAVNKILNREFPMRPSTSKCSECDFSKICAKSIQNFSDNTTPPPIQIPEVNGVTNIEVRCLSDIV